MTNKDKIKKLALEMLKDSIPHMEQKIEKALNSGAIDIDGWDEKDAPMITPKCILAAVLEDEAVQYTGHGTSYQRRIRKEIKNIKYFI